MRTYEFYYSGPAEPDPKFPHAPTYHQMYNDFMEILESSGYTKRKNYINTTVTPTGKHVTMEINGYKQG